MIAAGLCIAILLRMPAQAQTDRAFDELERVVLAELAADPAT